jgi:hypothetical protein
MIIAKSNQVSYLEDSLHHFGTFWVKFIPTHLFSTQWGSLRILFIKLDTFGPILIAVDIGWTSTSQLQPTEDPQQFLSRFWHIWTIFEYIPYLLIPKPSCQSKWESSISVSTFWPTCESFIISSYLTFTKLWSPTQQVLWKKKLFSSFWPSCTNIKYSPYLTTAKPPSSTQ